MRICRFDDNRLGLVEGDRVRDITWATAELGPFRYPLPQHDVLIERLGDIARAAAERRGGGDVPLASVRLLAPVANPGKLVAAPVNYVKHLDEARADRAIHFGNQIADIHRVGLFLKATSSLIGPADPVALRFLDRRNDHEIELAVVIARVADRVKAADALDYVAGYAVGLDMTVRGPEERSMRKSIDTFSVLGPWLVTADEIPDPSGLALTLRVNGEIRQRANTSDLVLSVPELIEYASRFYTLHPGDVLYTGTPEGVGEVICGDTIDAEIERVGRLKIRVVDGIEQALPLPPSASSK